MAYDTPPPAELPEPGYYYHFKHDRDGPLNNYANYIYTIMARCLYFNISIFDTKISAPNWINVVTDLAFPE